MNFDVARLRAREDDATEMEERVTRASLFFRERNRVERSSLRESARFGIDHDDERQRWSYRKRREGRTVSVFHTGMHGVHQFSLKPINLLRGFEPKTKLSMADERVSDAALLRAKNRCDVCGAGSDPFRRKINIFMTRYTPTAIYTIIK